MKGWRERTADIFAKRGEIAAKMKSALGPGPSDLAPKDSIAESRNLRLHAYSGF